MNDMNKTENTIEASEGGYLICEWCETEAFSGDGKGNLTCDCGRLVCEKGNPTKVLRYPEE